LNGELIAYSNHKYVIGMNLTAGTGIAKDGGPFAPGADAKTPFPNYFNVDYIRVYKTDTVPNYTEVRNNLSFETDTTFQMSGADFKARIDQKSLKNNPDKKVKKSNVITLSVMQLSHANISVRGIGLGSGDKCRIRVKDDKNKLITELPLTTNIETVITIGNTKFITFQADVNNHRIEERIELQ
jgi:hypothetical protein